jgi:S-methylmethionine-dependent homocysteine/selenocysteine methylase
MHFCFSLLVLAVLFNCSEPEAITVALQKIHADQAVRDRLQTEGTVLGAYANRLTPVRPDWTLAESDGPQTLRTDLDPARYCQEFASKCVRELGVKVVGGCCGITPEHVAFLRDHLEASK